MKNIRLLSSILLFSLLFFISCSIFKPKKEEEQRAELPKIETMRDVVENHMKKVTVVGVYTQVDIRLRRENPPVKYSGQVCLTLEDNTQIFIYPPTSQEAIRARKEIRTMEHQQVKAVGIIYKHMPQSDAVQNRLPANIISSPYMSYIETFELLNPPPPRRRGR
ncbi:MAG: hypothetical protein PHT69_05480 [Bacteroidales bacterium]|nr:hypothetical protein [Bacteroidales bacterium]